MQVSIRTIDKQHVIAIQSEYKDKDICSAIVGGKWNKKHRLWTYNLTPATVMDIKLHAGEHVINSSADSDILINLVNRMERAQAIISTHDDYIPMIPEWRDRKEGNPPWKHQCRAFWSSKEFLGFGQDDVGGGNELALGMGAGKTRTTIDIICNHANHLDRVLIICPLAVIEVWDEQFQRYGDINRFTMYLPNEKHSVEKKAKLALQHIKYAGQHGQIPIIMINYESAWRSYFSQLVRDIGFSMVVADEIHRISDPKSQSSKFFDEISYGSTYRIGLTGTPFRQNILSVFGQYKFIDKGVYGTNKFKFENQYSIKGGFEGRQVIGFQNETEFMRRFHSVAYQVKTRDVVDLPETVLTVRRFSLSKEEQKIYDEMDNKLIVEIGNDEKITAANALVKVLRLMQITSGRYNGIQIGTSRKEALRETLEGIEPDEPVVVFAMFVEDFVTIKEVTESLGRTYCELSGRHKEKKKFTSGEANTIGIQLKTGSEGIDDLVISRYAIYHNVEPSLTRYNQSKDRLSRPGQTRTTIYTHIVARGTRDEDVLAALQSNQNVIDSITKKYQAIYGERKYGKAR